MTRSFWKGSLQSAATTPDGLDPVETFTTNASGRVILGILPSGDYDYSASWSNEGATGTYTMPDSGTCPVNPYEVHLDQLPPG